MNSWKRSCVTLIFVVCIVAFIPVVSSAASISGVWREVSTSDHVNSYVVFSQDGSAIYVTCYWEFKGTSIVWHGRGYRNGNYVEYNYKHSDMAPGWSVEGVQKLTVSVDGRVMDGQWSNSRGESGYVKFIKVRP